MYCRGMAMGNIAGTFCLNKIHYHIFYTTSLFNSPQPRTLSTSNKYSPTDVELVVVTKTRGNCEKALL